MRMLTMGWGKMAWSDTGGDSVPLVLLAGTGCDTPDWRGVLAALPASRRVVSLDFRAHGRSSTPAEGFTLQDLADDAMALLAHLRVERAVLVGHSLGGIVATAAAARSPGPVAGLVLLEGWTNTGAEHAFEGDRVHGALGRAPVSRIRRKFDRTLERLGPAGLAALRASVVAWDGLPFLRRATIPVLEVYGDMGRTAETLARLSIPDNPAIELRWIEGAGHYLPHERPQEVARLCEEFAARVGVPGSRA